MIKMRSTVLLQADAKKLKRQVEGVERLAARKVAKMLERERTAAEFEARGNLGEIVVLLNDLELRLSKQESALPQPREVLLVDGQQKVRSARQIKSAGKIKRGSCSWRRY